MKGSEININLKVGYINIKDKKIKFINKVDQKTNKKPEFIQKIQKEKFGKHKRLNRTCEQSGTIAPIDFKEKNEKGFIYVNK